MGRVLVVSLNGRKMPMSRQNLTLNSLRNETEQMGEDVRERVLKATAWLDDICGSCGQAFSMHELKWQVSHD